MRAQRIVATFVAIVLLGSQQTFGAASELSDVRTEATPKGGVVVTLAFASVIPFGWHVNGLGTRRITVALPATRTSVNLHRVRFPGSGALAGIHLAPSGAQLDVTLDLAASTSVFTSTSGNAISIVLGASPSPAPSRQAVQQQPYTSGAPGKYEIVPLKYADVSEVVGMLVQGQQVPPNDSFAPSGSIFTLPTSSGGGTQQYQASAALPAQPQSVAERINDNIAIDRRLNAIILSGTPAEIAAFKAAIAQIDVPLASVMLVCEVVELSETAARDLGIDFTSGPGSPIVSAQGLTASGGPPGFRADFQAHLFATVSHGGGKILATPRVLALNGTPAQILTGDALPIISTVIYPGTPTITQQTVNYIAVGVNLQIQPRITSDNFVTSHIFAEVSSVTAFVPTPQGNVPQISLRQATTAATVGDGQPFVIGGLLKDEEIQNLSKIPGLGDLPIIGGAFRTRHDMTTRTNLYIIITPHIIRQPG